MPLTEAAAALSALAVIAGALSSYLAARTQRDMARLKNEILEGINGKYVSRKEADILARERDKFESGAEEKIKETRSQHHILHEEFIACRAAHRAEKG
jgi:hypothetical protein